jgi:flagellar biosynthesis/type III secretory pathway ATPase
MRRQAGYLALAIAASFRDEGQDVPVLMDSVTASPWRSATSASRAGAADR